MIVFLFLLGLALGAVPPSDGQEVKLLCGNCPKSWFSFNGRCYKYVFTTLTWADAEFHCVLEGANLVSIHSEEEHTFVKNLIKNFDPAEKPTWNGLSDIHKEGHWMWSDGSAVNFFFWNKAQPDNYHGDEDCGELKYGPNLEWNDAPCSHKYSFVCASR